MGPKVAHGGQGGLDPAPRASLISRGTAGGTVRAGALSICAPLPVFGSISRAASCHGQDVVHLAASPGHCPVADRTQCVRGWDQVLFSHLRTLLFSFHDDVGFPCDEGMDWPAFVS